MGVEFTGSGWHVGAHVTCGSVMDLLPPFGWMVQCCKRTGCWGGGTGRHKEIQIRGTIPPGVFYASSNWIPYSQHPWSRHQIQGYHVVFNRSLCLLCKYPRRCLLKCNGHPPVNIPQSPRTLLTPLGLRQPLVTGVVWPNGGVEEDKKSRPEEGTVGEINVCKNSFWEFWETRADVGTLSAGVVLKTVVANWAIWPLTWGFFCYGGAPDSRPCKAFTSLTLH